MYTPKHKHELLRQYQIKQNILGKIFDFKVAKQNGEIFITRYYDHPHREVVVIPDFVDRLAIDYASIGIFSYCIGLKKVIMGPNVKGSLQSVFADFEGEVLDLTDFDTSNITDMQHMFYDSKIKHIILGDKFITSKVTNMKRMFYGCEANSINLGNNFDTSNVELMSYMFKMSKISGLNLGNKFDTSKVKDMVEMFYGCEIPTLFLGDKFDTSNVVGISNMFAFSKIWNLNLGNKFTLKKAKQANNIFNNSQIQFITVDGYSTNSVPRVEEYLRQKSQRDLFE